MVQCENIFRRSVNWMLTPESKCMKSRAKFNSVNDPENKLLKIKMSVTKTYF